METINGDNSNPKYSILTATFGVLEGNKVADVYRPDSHKHWDYVVLEGHCKPIHSEFVGKIIVAFT